jgi:DNA ligase 1
LFAFDLLYLNGEPLLKETLKRRRELLWDSFVPIPGKFNFATFMNASSVDEIQTFLDEAINSIKMPTNV